VNTSHGHGTAIAPKARRSGFTLESSTAARSFHGHERRGFSRPKHATPPTVPSENFTPQATVTHDLIDLSNEKVGCAVFCRQLVYLLRTLHRLAVF
jgi:hypothetical protein